MNMPSVYALIISGLALAITSITDIRKREICPWVCLALIVLASFDPGKNFGLSILTSFICFLPLFISARIGNGGDGDALLMGAVGYATPFLYGVYTMLFASILYVIVLAAVELYKKKRRMQLPYAPFCFAGWLVVLIFYLTGAMG